MHYTTLLLSVFPAVALGMLIDARPKEHSQKNSTKKQSPTSASKDKHYLNHFTDIASDAQESANFFSDISPHSFSARTFEPPEYESLFDAFPNLPYFPDFGEIFRIQKSTTAKPPFHFPDYIRDAFPENSVKPGRKPAESSTIGGGRRPARRPPRPASSGTKAKLAKQNQSEPKEKVKPGKTKITTKAKDYPKIFRFTADRVNLADFDMRKKTNGNYESLAKGDDLDSNKIQRGNFLILHGGVFEIDRTANSVAANGFLASGSDLIPVTENAVIGDEDELVFGSRIDKPS